MTEPGPPDEEWPLIRVVPDGAAYPIGITATHDMAVELADRLDVDPSAVDVTAIGRTHRGAVLTVVLYVPEVDG